MSTALINLPPNARALLERERVPFADACDFLGMTRQAANPKAIRYQMRVHRLTSSGKPFDVTKLRPECNVLGEYTEIPCYRAGHGRMCRTELLVPMVYPEVGWPG